MKAYSAVLIALISLFLALVLTRPAVEAIFLRAPGALFQQAVNGKIENLYTLKLVNKTMRDLPVELRLENAEGVLRIMGDESLVVPGGKIAQTSVLIELESSKLAGTTTRLKIGVYSNGKRIQTVNTAFAGPRRPQS